MKLEANRADKPTEEPLTRVLVLAKNPEQLRGAIAFLVRRGIDVVSATTMNDAIATLAKQNANFVLLSVNFPHPKLDMLPSLFQQTFNAETIVFAEVADRKQENRLASIKARHVIFGFASGPSILLRIRQIEKESQEASGGGSRSKEGSSDDSRSQPRDDKGDIVISSRAAGGNDNNVVLRGGGLKSSEEMAAQFKSALDRLENDPSSLSSGNPRGVEGSSMSEGSLVKTGSGTYVQKGKAPTKFSALEKGKSIKRGLGVMRRDPRLKDSPYLNHEAAKEKELGARKQAEKDAADERKRNLQLARERAQADKDKKEREKQAGNKEGGASASTAAANGESADKSGIQKARDSVLHDAEHESLKSKAGGIRPGQPDSSDSPSKGPFPRASDKNEEGSLASEESQGKVDRPELELSEDAKARERQLDEKRNQATRPLFMSCARRALMDVTSLTQFNDGPMNAIEFVTLLTLKSRSYAGCLMIAIGNIKLDKSDVADALYERFLYHLVASGASFEKDEITIVQFEQGGFATQLFGEGEFTISVRDQFWEAGFSYFPLISLEPPIAEASDAHHSAVRVSDIDSNTPVNFEAFIYFPVNSKYVRYLKRGSIFASNQKSKFVSRGINNMFIKRESVKEFREHYARSNLKNEIDKMKIKKAKKKAS